MNCPNQATIEEVAQRTIECLKATVPDQVPGCAFLSGGQSNENATIHLNAMNASYGSVLPWNLTFSYGRALQSSALQAWGGKPENVARAQSAFYHRAKFNSMATFGSYNEDLEIVKV